SADRRPHNPGRHAEHLGQPGETAVRVDADAGQRLDAALVRVDLRPVTDDEHFQPRDLHGGFLGVAPDCSFAAAGPPGYSFRMLAILRLIVVLGLLAALRIPGGADEPAKPEAHGAFAPVVRPKVPQVKGTARTDIDRFILAALEAKGLTLNAEADRATLIRRVAFVLTGLPPTIAELDALLADKSPDAYEKMVDRYLASSAYGERWGKFWLDAAGYADSNGYFSADSDRPLAWRYRDYVIRSFNADKPYDKFVREQIAGDELVGYTPGGDITPNMVEALTATHFLRNAPDGPGASA